MTSEHVDRYIILFAAGLGLLLAGGLNVLLGRRAWLRAAATVAACAAVVAGLAAFARPELALRAGGVLVGVLLVAALVGSESLTRRLARVAGYLRRPAPRWSLVALAGLAVVIGSGVAFERADTAAIEEGMQDLELVVGRPPSRPTEAARATTDRGAQIVLKEPITQRGEGELSGSEARALQTSRVGDQLIRRGGPTELSNCHGWVFTGGKFLLSPDDVELILKENGYHEVQEPRAGDLVVYRQGGVVAHTAVVRYVAEGQPVLVESKWGTLGVFLHPASKSAYGTEFTFHRSARQDYNAKESPHLLVGLGGPAGPNAGVPVVAEE